MPAGKRGTPREAVLRDTKKKQIGIAKVHIAGG